MFASKNLFGKKSQPSTILNFKGSLSDWSTPPNRVGNHTFSLAKMEVLTTGKDIFSTSVLLLP
jgi:hypothetical protein